MNLIYTPIDSVLSVTKSIGIYKVYQDCFFIVVGEAIVGTMYGFYCNPNKDVLTNIAHLIMPENVEFEIKNIPLVFRPHDVAETVIIGNR